MFFQGGKGHTPNVPSKFTFPPDRRRKDWDVSGERVMLTEVHLVEDSLKIVGEDRMGVVTEGEWFTLLPRREVCLMQREGDAEQPGLGRRLYNALEVLEKSSDKTCRGQSRNRFIIKDGPGSNYVDVGFAPHRAKKGSSFKMKALEKKENCRHLEALLAWTRRVEKVALEHLPQAMIMLLEEVKERCHSLRQGGALKAGALSDTWPGLVAGRNVFLNVHTDMDFIWSLTTVVGPGEPMESDPIACYFCFPTLGVAVPLRNGDLLLFNTQIPHCVSSRCNGQLDNYCVSMYMKALLVSGNDNSQVITDEEEKLAALALDTCRA